MAMDETPDDDKLYAYVSIIRQFLIEAPFWKALVIGHILKKQKELPEEAAFYKQALHIIFQLVDITRLDIFAAKLYQDKVVEK